MHFDVYVALAGLIVGFAVGMTGMGGGALMTPILVLLFKVQPLAAVSSDLVAALLMRPFGSAVHVASHTVRWPLVRWLTLGSVPSAFLGVVLLRSFGSGKSVQSIITIALGAVVLAALAAMLMRPVLERGRQSGDDETLAVKRVPTLALGAVTGLIVGLTSVGSGTLVIVALLFMYPRLRGSQLVGTDLTQGIPMVGAAAVAHILYGDFQLALTTSIIVGSIPGVVLGALASSHISTNLVRTALSVVLLVTGLKLVNVPVKFIGVALAVALVVAAGYLTATAWKNRRSPERMHNPGPIEAAA